MLITILNIYNLLNNIKFTKEKKIEKKNYPVFDFLNLKVKYHTKKKKKKINHSTAHNLNTNDYLKYL